LSSGFAYQKASRCSSWSTSRAQILKAKKFRGAKKKKIGLARISGDIDEEAERASIALGFEPRGIMKQVLLWEKHPQDFL